MPNRPLNEDMGAKRPASSLACDRNTDAEQEQDYKFDVDETITGLIDRLKQWVAETHVAKLRQKSDSEIAETDAYLASVARHDDDRSWTAMFITGMRKEANERILRREQKLYAEFRDLRTKMQQAADNQSNGGKESLDVAMLLQQWDTIIMQKKHDLDDTEGRVRIICLGH